VGLSLFDLALPLVESWKLLVFGPVVAGLTALTIATYTPPTFTAKTTFVPPQQQQSTAASVLSSLGPLAGLAAGSGLQTPSDQYVSLMRSVSVSDRIIDAFGLMEQYKTKFRVDARKLLGENARFAIGKKDGLITVEVDDLSPQRAADMANAYVDELRRMTESIALTEAQQRRKFFEGQLQQTKEKLVLAQQALQASGLTEGALKAEPKSAAETYARLRAEIAATEVRLSTLRRSLTDSAPEIQQQQGALETLRRQLAQYEKTTTVQGGPDYIGKYREFKYQETLFDLLARQYELARVDESREGTLIQVVDRATPPEMKSKPRRGAITIITTLVAAALLVGFVLVRRSWRESLAEPANSDRVARLRARFSRHRA
jgi:uncharacterized protein involved in exopolysaccharide biosynthesis